MEVGSKDRLALQATSGTDPQETFIISVALREVSGLSSRTEQELTENFSANAAVGAPGPIRQLSICDQS
jgi:hypothetical protein